MIHLYLKKNVIFILLGNALYHSLVQWSEIIFEGVLLSSCACLYTRVFFHFNNKVPNALVRH